MKRIAVLAIALNLAGALQAQILPTFCDNFDTQDIWKDTSLSGSPWVPGAPSGGGFPSTAHSAPDVWGIGLTGSYLNSSDSYLISPQFNLS